MSELTEKDYWNKRAKDMKHQGVMCVMAHHRAAEHERIVKQWLSQWKDKSVLDVACGYGRFSEGMNNYVGVDFSEEMIRLAKADHPTKTFAVIDAHTLKPQTTYDVVFSVISLSSLNQTPQEFCKTWKPYAKEYVACFEFDTFYIFPCVLG